MTIFRQDSKKSILQKPLEFENVFNKHNSLKGGEIYRNDHLKLEKVKMAVLRSFYKEGKLGGKDS